MKLLMMVIIKTHLKIHLVGWKDSFSKPADLSMMGNGFDV